MHLATHLYLESVLLTVLYVCGVFSSRYVLNRYSMSAERDSPALVRVGNKVLIAGGISSKGKPTNTVDVWDLESGSLLNPMVMSTKRGKLYGFSMGYRGIFVDLTAGEAEVYNDVTGTWTLKTSSVTRSAASACSRTECYVEAVGNYVVVLYDQGRKAFTWHVPTDKIDTFDLCGRSSCEAITKGVHVATVGKFALFAGGVSSNGKEVSTVKVFNGETGSFETALRLSRGRSYLKSTVVNSKIIFAGGLWNSPPSSSSSSKLDVYCTVDVIDTNTKVLKTYNLRTKRSHFNLVSAGNLVYFAGGLPQSSQQYTKTVEVLDISTGSWKPNLQLSAARANVAASRIHGEYAIFGGGLKTSSSYSNQFDVFSANAAQESVTTNAGFVLPDIGNTLDVDNHAFFAGGIQSQGATSVLTILSVVGDGCDTALDCLDVTEDFNFVQCVDHACSCSPRFAGTATETDKCRCDGILVWEDNTPTCVPHGICSHDHHWMCLEYSQDYNFVKCDDGVCVCRQEDGFVGSATNSSKCRCPGDVMWDKIGNNYVAKCV